MVSSTDSNVIRMDGYLRKPPDCNPDPDLPIGDPIMCPDEWYPANQVTLEGVREETNTNTVEECALSCAKAFGSLVAVVYTLDTGELEVRLFHNEYMKRYGRRFK